MEMTALDGAEYRQVPNPAGEVKCAHTKTRAVTAQRCLGLGVLADRRTKESTVVFLQKRPVSFWVGCINSGVCMQDMGGRYFAPHVAERLERQGERPGFVSFRKDRGDTIFNKKRLKTVGTCLASQHGALLSYDLLTCHFFKLATSF